MILDIHLASFVFLLMAALPKPEGYRSIARGQPPKQEALQQSIAWLERKTVEA
jgi:hypothetical protein